MVMVWRLMDFLVVLMMLISIDSGCLNGIIRNIVISLARDLGIKVEIKALKFKDIRQADEIFLTNSLKGIMSVQRVDTIIKEIKAPGPMTSDLYQAYRAVINS